MIEYARAAQYNVLIIRLLPTKLVSEQAWWWLTFKRVTKVNMLFSSNKEFPSLNGKLWVKSFCPLLLHRMVVKKERVKPSAVTLPQKRH
jgi:hypothetical protein